MSRPSVHKSRPAMLSVLAVLAMLTLLTPLSLAEEPALAEQERVTALDVYIEVGGAAGVKSEVPDLPRNLRAEDFEVRLEGDELVPVGFFDPRAGAADDREPWTVVVYFDLRLAARDSVRWGASELWERVSSLVELGKVEIVAGGDSPVRVLAPTRDRELVAGELAGLAIDPRGVHEVIKLRSEVLEAIREFPEETATPDWARTVVENEIGAVQRRLDDLLLYLIDREGGGSKKALVWITDGFDLEPAGFYREHGLDLPSGTPSLAAPARRLAETLAGYGWVTLSLAPPEPGPGLVPGWRIGKWLYRPRMPTGLIGGTLVREERRDPKKAESHLEIGNIHLERDETESAQEAFEKALYHFAGDPRTSKRQAAAKAGLGRALEAQDRFSEARQAFRHAVELDPTLASLYPQSRPGLLDPTAALDLVAGETSGRTVFDAGAAEEAVTSLGRRARLTYQVSGWPRGALGGLEVAIGESDRRLHYPRWARSGTPQTIAAARARLLLAGELVEGDLEVVAVLDEEPTGGAELRVRLDRPQSTDTLRADRPRKLRVSVARGRPEGAIGVRHETVELSPDLILEDWLYRLDLEPLAEEDWVAVVVEDLESGEWGAGLPD